MKKIVVIILFLIVIQTVVVGLNNNYSSDELLEIDSSADTEFFDNNSCWILFIGSSYFNYNDLTGLFERLALKSGKEVFVDNHGRNGFYLYDHAFSFETASKINERDWDYVVLQGVGRTVAYPDYFTDHPVYPALVELQDKIYENCEFTKMIYCMPWAFEDGMTWYQDWTDTYEDMQIKILETTLNYSNDLDFYIAPVGWAWYSVLKEKEYPLHYLHMSDWNHPSLKGSYLMACVLFSTVYLEYLNDNSFYGGLIKDEAKFFQTIASEIVFENLSLWNLVDAFDNNPPEKPLKPSGPEQIKPGNSYSYSSSTTDVDGDLMYYLFDWGDGNVSEWVGPYISGNNVTASHIWGEKGTYYIRVKAKDEHCQQSGWSDLLQVNVSKGKSMQIFYRLNFFFDNIYDFFCPLFSNYDHFINFF
jgi:uncharacterized protein DUF4886/PKD domain-containing protein